MGRHVDQLESDTCHHCKGDMWHIRTADMAGSYDTWKMTGPQANVVGVLDANWV
jgi:hypothetical protein